MKNSIFILSYDRDSVSDMTKFHEGITTNPLVKNWSHYINSSYLLVANTQKASVLAKSLKDALGDVPYFVMEVNLSNYWGVFLKKHGIGLKKSLEIRKVVFLLIVFWV